MLTEATMIPTVELSVQPSDRIGEVESPWVLLHAHTAAVTAGHVVATLAADRERTGALGTELVIVVVIGMLHRGLDEFDPGAGTPSTIALACERPDGASGAGEQHRRSVVPSP